MKRNVIGIAFVVIALAVMQCCRQLENGRCLPAACRGKESSCRKAEHKHKAVKAVAKATEAQPKALPRLLDLGATTCVPCKMMAKVLDELKSDYKGKLQVDFIDVKKDTSAVAKYNVKLDSSADIL